MRKSFNFRQPNFSDMKVLEKKNYNSIKEVNIIYDPSLDNLPISQIALEKAEKARETLRKFPFPNNLKGI